MPSRRQIIAAGLAAVGGTAHAAGPKKGYRNVTADPDQPPIIDTHQHLWDLSRFRLPWTTGNEKLGHSFLPRDYAAATAGLGVERSIYMEVDLDPAQQRDEAAYVVEQCQRDDNPMVAGVISGRPAEPGFEAYITPFHHSPHIKGIRQVLHAASTPPGYCLKPEFVAGVRLLGDLDLSFDLCPRPAELADGEKLIGQCPRTRFILDHCGNASVQWPVDSAERRQWERDITAIAAHPNVICKVSGIVAGAKPDAWQPADLQPYVMHVIHAFGWDRVVFGGDWPVCTLAATYRQWVEALRWIVRDETREHRRKLFHDNAVRHYKLT